MESHKDLASTLIADILLWSENDEVIGREELEDLLESLIPDILEKLEGDQGE